MTALFVRRDSIYKTIAGVDAWDEDRDARTWPGGTPVIVHPPCRSWGVLAYRARPLPGEQWFALLALGWVRAFGGILEHPRGSKLWKFAHLPEPGKLDSYGGYTLEVEQYHWGHRAAKATRLYIVGCHPDRLPSIPHREGTPTHVVTNSHGFRKGDPGFRSRVSNREREATPPAFAEWLVEVAKRCRSNSSGSRR